MDYHQLIVLILTDKPLTTSRKISMYSARLSAQFIKYTIAVVIALAFNFISTAAQQVKIQKSKGAKSLNVIFFLTDDHRFDFMGFTGKVPWLQTPNMDKMAKEGVWVKNATVTTALCSPSRASILTGQYAHTHKVVDNFSPLPTDLIFFPQYLQKAGYRTALFGKWHMGNAGDQPQKGFHYWESFKGQGVYFNPLLNINGTHVQYEDSTYITDILTQHALDWLKKQDQKNPFFLFLSHKGVHDEFMPAPRHRGKYKSETINYPSTINVTASLNSKIFGDTLKSPTPAVADKDSSFNVKDIPKWVKAQRNSWHGVDFMYDGRVEFDEFYRRYCETLLSIDESLGALLSYLKQTGLDENTVVFYMADNGFLMGEHGLIDKRNMYSESHRVPLLIHAPGTIKGGFSLEQVIQNIDIAPTILEIAGLTLPAHMQGKSFYPLLREQPIVWRDKTFYEYYWEFSYPQTPTTFGVRMGRYKFVFYPGIWDISEFFDLQTDPEEKKNLYRVSVYQPMIAQLREELWKWLQETGGLQIPLKPIREFRIDHGLKGLL